MKFASITKLAFSNLLRRKLRSFLTILGVSIAVGVLFFLINTAESVKKQITDFMLSFEEATVINVYEKNSFNSLLGESKESTSSAKNKKITEQTIADFKKLPNVKDAFPNVYVPYDTFNLTLSNSKKATSSAVTLNNFRVDQKNMLKYVYQTDKEVITKGSFFKDNNGYYLIAQGKLADILKSDIGDKLTLKVEIAAREAQIGLTARERKYLKDFEIELVGVALEQPKYEGEVRTRPMGIVSDALAKELYNLQPEETYGPDYFGPIYKKGQYEGATVMSTSIEHTKAVAKSIKDKGYDSFSVFDGIDAINQLFLVIQGILATFSLVGLIIALIGISNTMFMSTLERTREIGILKALGAKDKDIYRIFLFESALFGLLGAAVGIGFASLMGFLIAFIGNVYVQSEVQKLVGGSASPIDAPTVKYTIEPVILLITIGFSLVLSMFAGFLPARKASKLDPIKALKYE